MADVAALLRPGGRLLLDLFHREYFVARQGQSTDTRDPRCLAITNEMSGHRLTSTIEYADGSSEQMDFELFTPSDIEARAAPAGFELVEACCWWDADRPPTADEQRFQVVFERSG